MNDGLTATQARRNPCLPCLLLGNPGVLPLPVEAAYLGRMLELEHGVPDGRFLRHEWTPEKAPILLWEESERALYVLPGVWPKKGASPDAAALSGPAGAAYLRWTGRAPKGALRARGPKVHVRRAGAARHIVYRSNKWGVTATDWQNYVHPFGAGVEAELAPGTPPAAFRVSGGRLRLTKRGLEG